MNDHKPPLVLLTRAVDEMEGLMELIQNPSTGCDGKLLSSLQELHKLTDDLSAERLSSRGDGTKESCCIEFINFCRKNALTWANHVLLYTTLKEEAESAITSFFNCFQEGLHTQQAQFAKELQLLKKFSSGPEDDSIHTIQQKIQDLVALVAKQFSNLQSLGHEKTFTSNLQRSHSVDNLSDKFQKSSFNSYNTFNSNFVEHKNKNSFLHVSDQQALMNKLKSAGYVDPPTIMKMLLSFTQKLLSGSSLEKTLQKLINADLQQNHIGNKSSEEKKTLRLSRIPVRQLLPNCVCRRQAQILNARNVQTHGILAKVRHPAHCKYEIGGTKYDNQEMNISSKSDLHRLSRTIITNKYLNFKKNCPPVRTTLKYEAARRKQIASKANKDGNVFASPLRYTKCENRAQSASMANKDGNVFASPLRYTKCENRAQSASKAERSKLINYHTEARAKSANLPLKLRLKDNLQDNKFTGRNQTSALIKTGCLGSCRETKGIGQSHMKNVLTVGVGQKKLNKGSVVTYSHKKSYNIITYQNRFSTETNDSDLSESEVPPATKSRTYTLATDLLPSEREQFFPLPHIAPPNPKLDLQTVKAILSDFKQEKSKSGTIIPKETDTSNKRSQTKGYLKPTKASLLKRRAHVGKNYLPGETKISFQRNSPIPKTRQPRILNKQLVKYDFFSNKPQHTKQPFAKPLENNLMRQKTFTKVSGQNFRSTVKVQKTKYNLHPEEKAKQSTTRKTQQDMFKRQKSRTLNNKATYVIPVEMERCTCGACSIPLKKKTANPNLNKQGTHMSLKDIAHFPRKTTVLWPKCSPSTLTEFLSDQQHKTVENKRNVTVSYEDVKHQSSDRSKLKLKRALSLPHLPLQNDLEKHAMETIKNERYPYDGQLCFVGKRYEAILKLRKEKTDNVYHCGRLNPYCASCAKAKEWSVHSRCHSADKIKERQKTPMLDKEEIEERMLKHLNPQSVEKSDAEVSIIDSKIEANLSDSNGDDVNSQVKKESKSPGKKETGNIYSFSKEYYKLSATDEYEESQSSDLSIETGDYGLTLQSKKELGQVSKLDLIAHDDVTETISHELEKSSEFEHRILPDETRQKYLLRGETLKSSNSVSNEMVSINRKEATTNLIDLREKPCGEDISLFQKDISKGTASDGFDRKLTSISPKLENISTKSIPLTPGETLLTRVRNIQRSSFGETFVGPLVKKVPRHMHVDETDEAKTSLSNDPAEEYKADDPNSAEKSFVQEPEVNNSTSSHNIVAPMSDEFLNSQVSANTSNVELSIKGLTEEVTTQDNSFSEATSSKPSLEVISPDYALIHNKEIVSTTASEELPTTSKNVSPWNDSHDWDDQRLSYEKRGPLSLSEPAVARQYSPRMEQIISIKTDRSHNENQAMSKMYGIGCSPSSSIVTISDPSVRSYKSGMDIPIPHGTEHEELEPLEPISIDVSANELSQLSSFTTEVLNAEDEDFTDSENSNRSETTPDVAQLKTQI